MVDDWVISIMGSVTMQIKMHDGMVRKLDCSHIPELQKNFILLGTLAKNGTRYAGGGDLLKVTKRSLVIMKGKMNRQGIYILKVITVMGNVAISQS